MTDLLFWDERTSLISKLMMDFLNCKKCSFWRNSMRQIDENFLSLSYSMIHPFKFFAANKNPTFKLIVLTYPTTPVCLLCSNFFINRYLSVDCFSLCHWLWHHVLWLVLISDRIKVSETKPNVTCCEMNLIKSCLIQSCVKIQLLNVLELVLEFQSPAELSHNLILKFISMP